MSAGRPTKYNPEFHPLLVESLASQGYTDIEIADKLDICEKTLNNWKKEYPELLQSIKKGKLKQDELVENALLRRALGYKHEEDKIFQYEGQPIVVPTIKHYPPDTAAAFIWLKNRMPNKWRDKKELEHSGELTIKDAKEIATSILGKDDETPEIITETSESS
jgi:transposase-like protein